MTQVVQARCPHCQNVLRIPADWLNKAMRCKFCHNIFEARPRTSDTPLPPTAISAAPVARAAVPVSRAIPAAPVAATAVAAGLPAAGAADPLAFDDTEAAADTPAPRPRRKSASGGMLLLGAGLIVVLLGVPVATGAILAYKFNLFGSDGSSDEHHHTASKKGRDHHGKEPIVAVVRDAGNRDGAPRPKDRKGPIGKKPPRNSGGVFPRRALLINVCNYLYLNRVDPGHDQTSLTALKNHGLSNPPLNIPASQIFTLSDEGDSPHPTEVTVIKNAIKDFLDTSRAQDRVVILFAGHATEIEKDCFLIPIGGKREDPDTLLPLSWVFSQLAACKAQQKALILDVFRFAPARGFELPGAGASSDGEMGEVFDAYVQKPPPGVQVWTSCIKGQRSIEFEEGSVFLRALSRVRDGAAMSGIAAPTDPLPVGPAFVEQVNKKMEEFLGSAFTQTSRLSGTAPTGGPGYNPTEPVALPITLKMPVAPGGDMASNAEVSSILNELKMLPAVRKSKVGQDDRLLKASNLPPFPAKTLATYKVDDNKTLPQLLDEFKKLEFRKDYAKQHPVRAAVLNAIDAMNKSETLTMRETLNGPINDKAKAAFFNEQKEPGILIFELKKVLGAMKNLSANEEEMDKETSKRWRAHFDFTEARLKARLVYIYEYTYLLGQIRRDELPPLEKGADGWRVASREKIQVTEPEAKRLGKELQKTWKAIEKKYRNTPWEIMAYREGLVSLGLEWKAKKD